MAITVSRPNLNWKERIYLPAILGGMAITFAPSQEHALRAHEGDDAVSRGEMGFADARALPRRARARPRRPPAAIRCVACQLCEFICPPRAIKIIPGELPGDDKFAKVEKYPNEFDIDMIRCIYCGMCEEVCPEQAIFLRKDYAITGFTRADMVHDKEKLLEIGGVMEGVVLKWNEKK